MFANHLRLITIIALALPASLAAQAATLHPIPLTQAYGPLTLKPVDRVLLVNNTHVSARELLALDRWTLALKWRYAGKVSGFVVHAKSRIVVANDMQRGLVGLDARTGRRLWERPGLALNSGIYPDLELRSATIYSGRRHGGHGTFVEAASGKMIVSLSKGPLTPVRVYRFTKAGLRFVRIEWRGLRRTGRLLAALSIGSGKQDPLYVWSLTKRRFTLERRVGGRTTATLGWVIPPSTYKRPVDRVFNGDPEPEKLVARLRLVDGKLMFHEHYSTYRWSWGRGTNRLTLVDLLGMKIRRQIWGQRHHRDPYRGFFFTDTFVFNVNGVDADLGRSKRYQLLSLSQLGTSGSVDKSAQPGAPTLAACNQLLELAPILLACMQYTSKQIKPKRYAHTLVYRPIALLHKQRPIPVTLLNGADRPQQFVVDSSLYRLLVVVEQRQKGDRRALLVYTFPRLF